MQSEDVRGELFVLAECYDRLAIQAERRQRRELQLAIVSPAAESIACRNL